MDSMAFTNILKCFAVLFMVHCTMLIDFRDGFFLLIRLNIEYWKCARYCSNEIIFFGSLIGSQTISIQKQKSKL